MNRKNADDARRLGSNPDRPPTTTSSTGYATAWRDDWMPATKETLMDEPTDERPVEAFTAGQLAEILARYPDRPVHLASPTQIAPATSMEADILEPDGPTVWLIDADWDDETAAPRASQAATAANGPGDDAGAAHGAARGSAGHTALRDRIRGAFHTIAPDCVAYHATDCIDCTQRADAVMSDIQREFDQHWADLACRTNERDQWREEARLMTENRDYWRDQVAKEWRQRAEAAEAQLRDQNGHQP